MARIRSIHPSICTDEAFVSMSALARVFFMTLWTECDDEGVFENKPVSLKMRLIPAENCGAEILLEEIEKAGFLVFYSFGGKNYGAVKNFRKWQRPKNPKSLYPKTKKVWTYVGLAKNEYPDRWNVHQDKPPLNIENDTDKPPSNSPKGDIETHLSSSQFPQKGYLSKQMEDGGDKMKERKKDSLVVLPNNATAVQEAFQLYNTTAAHHDWPIAKKLSDTRRQKLRHRLKGLDGMDGWSAAMARAGQSDFLTGRIETNKNWRPDLDFFLQESSMLRLIEGKYDNRQQHSNTGLHDFAC